MPGWRSCLAVGAAVVALWMLWPDSELALLAGLVAGAPVMFLVGRGLTPWASVPAAGITLAVMAARAGAHDQVPVVLTLATPYLAGAALRARDELARQLEEQAVELEAEREVYADLSVRYERARIASELHDIVAHAMSVMVVQASAGQRLVGDPQATAETFAAIAGAARTAEGDMRRLVTMLTDDVVAASPDLGVVEELVRRAAGSGLDVTLRLEGRRDGLTPASVEIAYAVVRESLTNALRYAAGAAVGVRVDGGDEALVVEVVNAPAPRAVALAGHGTGSGLAGLRERVGRAAGRIDAGPTEDGGWEVVATVPRRPEPVAV